MERVICNTVNYLNPYTHILGALKSMQIRLFVCTNLTLHSNHLISTAYFYFFCILIVRKYLTKKY